MTRLAPRCLAVITALVTMGCDGGPSGPATFAISDAGDSNVSLTIPPVTLLTGTQGITAEAYSFEDLHDGFLRKRWQLIVVFGNTPADGQTFTVVPAILPGADPLGLARVHLQESPAAGGFREWSALGGSVDILSRVGDTVTLALRAIRFQPATGGSGNAATGSFTLDGQLTIANINQPLPDS